MAPLGLKKRQSLKGFFCGSTLQRGWQPSSQRRLTYGVQHWLTCLLISVSPETLCQSGVLWEPDNKTALDVQDICLGKKLWKKSEGTRRARRQLCQPGLWWRWGEGGWEGEEKEAEETVKLKKAQRAISGGFKQKPLPQRKTIPTSPRSGVSTILNHGWGIAKGNGLGTENSYELQRAACSSWSSTPQNQRTERHSPDPQFWSWTCGTSGSKQRLGKTTFSSFPCTLFFTGFH